MPETHEIMSKPLPSILDELDSKIQELRGIINTAKEAVAETQAATDEARAAGAEAVERAKQIVEQEVAKVASDLVDREAKLLNLIIKAEKDLFDELDKVKKMAVETMNAFQSFRGAIIRGLNFTADEVNKSIS